MCTNHRNYIMLRVVFLLAFLIGTIAALPVRAESSVLFEWAKGMGGTSEESAEALAVDGSGFVYSTGFFFDTVDFDPNEGTMNLTSAGLDDIFISKLDKDGNPFWANRMGGTGYDVGTDLVVDGSGNLYVTGSFQNTADFTSYRGPASLVSAGEADIFISKHDESGGLLWAKRIGGIASDISYNIAVDGNANVYATGSFSGTVDFDPGAGTFNLSGAGSEDIFILKLDSNGNFVWAKRIGGTYKDIGKTITLDRSGNVYTIGSFQGNVDFDPAGGTFFMDSPLVAGTSGIFISKLNNNGNFVWAKSLGRTANNYGLSIAVDPGGNVYTAGSFVGTGDFDPGQGTFNLVSAGLDDIFISKLDNNGTFTWAKRIGDIASDHSYDIAVDGNSNVYTTGYFAGTVDFDPGIGIVHVISAAGSNDIFVSKLDTNGNYLWARGMGGDQPADQGNAALTDQRGNIYIAGNFQESADFDPTSHLTGAGGRDIFVMRLHHPQIYYVKWNASGTNDGTSWTDAYTDLEFALSVATRGDEIWVASGSYKPTIAESFSFKNGVAIYGGFAGTESSRSQRDVAANVTILSGDTGVVGDDRDNLERIIFNYGLDNTAVLDGFTISGGRSGNVYTHGAGMSNFRSSPTLANLIFTDNIAQYGGGMYNSDGSNPILQNVVFLGNQAEYAGGGIYNSSSSPTLTNVLFESNTVIGNGSDDQGGGMYNVYASPTLTNVTFKNNSAFEGGGVYNHVSAPVIDSVTFDSNSASQGGGMYNTQSSMTLTNVTFFNNSAFYGGAIYNDIGFVELNHVTISDNSATYRGGGIYNDGNLTVKNTILWGNTAGEGAQIYRAVGGDSFDHIVMQGGCPAGSVCTSADPLVGPLSNNGGFTQTISLSPGSSAIDAGNKATCPDTDQRGMRRPQGDRCDIGAYEVKGPIEVSIGGIDMNSYLLTSGQSKRVSYPGKDNGPVKIIDTRSSPIFAAERVIYKVNGIDTSFSEIMGVPENQLDTIYWLPWYNSKTLNTQLRIANPSETQQASVDVSIGGAPVSGSPFTIAAGQSIRKTFANINSGPVKIESNIPIVAAERVIYRVNGVDTSYSEMMALPNGQLDTLYWLPWYNNKTLNTQLRIANPGETQQASVDVSIGGMPVPGSPFTIEAGQSIRKTFIGIDRGPVKIESNIPVVAAERVIYRVNGVDTSFSEMMALPNSQLDTTYWLPWYNNKTLNTQLRIANPGDSQQASVDISIGGTPVPGSPFTVPAGGSIRKTFANIDRGPVKIESDIPIVAAERVIYRVNGVDTSFSEMMALPAHQLDPTFWFPWYNNQTLDTQLRFGVP